MTLPRFGRILPLQGDVLRLAGYVLSRSASVNVVPESDEERIKIIRSGRTALMKRTGKDFGYDLEEWVQFLEMDLDHQDAFKHPYGYGSTMRWVRMAIDDANRIRLVSKMTDETRS